MFAVSSDFIRVFKIGDNINYNLATLKLLYELSDEDKSRSSALRKPVIVTIVSIAEAMLYDFIGRIQSKEHVGTLPRETVLQIRARDYSKLANLVSGAKKYDLFEEDEDFYNRIDELRKLRNRVHIQNEKEHFERDEARAFSSDRQRNAEQMLETVSKSLARNHPRNSRARGFVKAFEFPWEEHFA